MQIPYLPADELAEVRYEIARLRLREIQLRKLLLDGPPELRSGRWFQVEMREIITKRLDLSKLPDTVLRDEAKYNENRQIVLHCRVNLLSSLQGKGPLLSPSGPLQ